MPMPCLVFLPLATQNIRVYCFYKLRPWAQLPIETFICALCCMFMIPSSLAIFPQCNSMSPKWLKLRPSEYKEFEANVGDHVTKLYYNKGL
ncbi:sideroflexin-2-like [Andrena cerasifolii]|uniref:sideroflexin-2-like n=1 Tax=Andrena cerasifolii TaxID=2819439 RepID=UPI00403821AC